MEAEDGPAVQDGVPTALPGRQADSQQVELPSTVDLDALVDSYLAHGPATYKRFKQRFEESGVWRVHRIYFSDSAAVVLLMEFRRSFLRRPEVVALLEYRAPSELGAEFAKTLFLADKIVTEARRTLSGKQLMLCLEMVHSALTYLFKVVDRHDVVSGDLQGQTIRTRRVEAFKLVSEQLHEAESFYVKAGARRAVLLYIVGMIMGIVVIGGGLWLLAPFLVQLPIPISSIVVGSCLVAGGLGAIVSVMVRMSRGELSLAQDVSTGQILLIGGFRPAIGVVSGLLVIVFLNSGLLPLEPTVSRGASGAGQWYFLVTISFIAGFSERLLRDAIVRAESQFVGGVKTKSGSHPGDQNSTR